MPTAQAVQAAHACTREVLMTIDDCRVSRGGHIPDEDIPPSSLAQGAPAADAPVWRRHAGRGPVFETPVDRTKHTRDPATFPPYWPWLWGSTSAIPADHHRPPVCRRARGLGPRRRRDLRGPRPSA